MPQSRRSDWLFSFVILGVIWGSSFLFIKLSLEFLTPAGVAFWRTALGALLLAVFVLVRRIKMPSTLKQWVLIWISGLFMSAIPAVLFSIAQQHVTSSLASIMNAATPIFTVVVILIAFREEKPKPNVLVGLIIGLIGVATVLAIWQGFGENDPISVLMLVGAVTCYGIGTPFIRKFVTPFGLPLHSAVLVQVGTSALSLLPYYLLTGPLTTAPITFVPAAAIAALGLFGTGYAYVLFYSLIDKAGSAIAASVTYITPLVGVLIGVILLGEKLSWHEPIGGIIVLLGAAIAQNRIKLPGALR